MYEMFGVRWSFLPRRQPLTVPHHRNRHCMCRTLLRFSMFLARNSTRMVSPTRSFSSSSIQGSREDKLTPNHSSNLLMFGEGLLGTSGEQHKKQRKMLNPVFSASNMRELLPVIQPIADEMASVFLHQVPGDGCESFYHFAPNEHSTATQPQ